MVDPDPRYSFDPLERRGVLLGLQPAQLVTLAISAVAAFAVARVWPAHGRTLLAVAVFGGIGASGLWVREGRPCSVWLVEAAAWLARRARGPVLDARPLSGRTTSRVDAPGQSTRTRQVATAPPGIDLAETAPLSGLAGLGVVIDRRQGTWAGVVAVRGGSFSLLDPCDQARRLDGWRVALNSLGRPGTAVRRIQWVERSFPAAGPRPQETLGLQEMPAKLESTRAQIADGDPRVDSYFELVAGARPSQMHDAWVVVAVDGPMVPGSPAGRRAADVLERELRLLEGQLRNADLQPSAPLCADRLASVVAGGYGLDLVAPVASRAGEAPAPWPPAEAEHWAHLQSGALWHATYWVAEWPRVDVRPDFLSPLLICEGRRTVSLVMEPVAPDRASREVRSARTADAADEQLRLKAGFLPSARRGREVEGVMRREAELADGHAEFRFSGYVTVHAGGPDSLDLACAEVEHAAQAAHLELRRLHGRQREAFAWTLPLARGLR